MFKNNHAEVNIMNEGGVVHSLDFQPNKTYCLYRNKFEFGNVIFLNRESIGNGDTLISEDPDFYPF